MRIVIGYDGSEWAEIALEELDAAGLPAESDVLVVSVTDTMPLLPMSCYSVVEARTFATISPTLRHARLLAADALAEASELARNARSRLLEQFPKWRIQAEAAPGIPQDVLVAKARQWNADLIVVGSHGRSALVRLFMGSVAQNVVHDAPCSVRVARRHDAAGSRQRIIVGVDSSPESALALAAVSDRCWPGECEARVVMALDHRLEVALATRGASTADDSVTMAQLIVRRAAEQLNDARIAAEPVLHRGDPRHVLVEEANRWNAGCIFVGARGLGRVASCLLGSVSAGVVSHAHCSVEVVRSAQS